MKQEFPLFIFILSFLLYTALFFVISYLTSRKTGGNSFFSGDKKAPWPIVAYGMVGASISGVTFISVPGNVMVQNFFYMPMVLGFVIGYILVANVLLPIYYKMNLVSIYSYLGVRFGGKTHITGSVVFMISRILGAAVRIFVVTIVLFAFVPKSIYADIPPVIPFGIITFIFLTLLYLYTYRGGVKTIIWTDVLQTTFMLGAVVLTVIFICKDMQWSFGQMVSSVANSQYSSMFDMNWGSGTNIFKQLIAGIFMTVAMTGLDQGMMQKNLACKDLKSSKKNIYTTAIILVVVNLLFLTLGAILSLYVAHLGGLETIGVVKTDEIFPIVASNYLGVGVGVFFLIGLISASYPSAGAAVTSLTTSFCVDFLSFESRNNIDLKDKNKIRKWVQFLFTLLFLIVIIVLFVISNDAVINLIYKLASYTYGPLLGMFTFGIFTKIQVKDGAIPYIAVAAPILCFVINYFSKLLFQFDLGFSLLILNGGITALLMWLFRNKVVNR